MKKTLMMVLCVALCASCAVKKPVQQPLQQPVQQQVDLQQDLLILNQQAKLDSLRRAQEIRRIELQMQAEEAELQAELEIAKLKASNAKHAMDKRLFQKIHIPCIEESYDKTGEYMAGLGISDEDHTEIGLAKAEANTRAVEDIAQRYIGVIKNGIADYAKTDYTSSGNKEREGRLERETEAVGMMVIEKYAEQVCIEQGQSDLGGYIFYVVVHVPLKNAIDETIDKLGVLQNEYDRQKFRDWMEKELGQQAAAKEAEKKELQDLRQQISE